MIRHVFIDLDDTLFDFKKAEHIAISETLSSLGVQPTEKIIKRYSEINKSEWERLERQEATREEILLSRFERLFAELGREIPGILAQKSYEKNLSEKHFYIEGAEELLIEIHKKYDLYIASNGTARVQDKRIASSGIAKYFKKIFISERVGFNKPKKEFFDTAFSEIEDFSRANAIIIGDSLSSDILGGKNAGILTCLYNPKGASKSASVTADFEISSLSEIPDLLSKL